MLDDLMVSGRVLPTGTISMSQVNDELKNPSSATISLGDADVRKLAGKATGPISMNDLRGKSAIAAMLTVGRYVDGWVGYIPNVAGALDPILVPSNVGDLYFGEELASISIVPGIWSWLMKGKWQTTVCCRGVWSQKYVDISIEGVMKTLNHGGSYDGWTQWYLIGQDAFNFVGNVGKTLVVDYINLR